MWSSLVLLNALLLHNLAGSLKSKKNYLVYLGSEFLSPISVYNFNMLPSLISYVIIYNAFLPVVEHTLHLPLIRKWQYATQFGLHQIICNDLFVLQA